MTTLLIGLSIPFLIYGIFKGCKKLKPMTTLDKVCYVIIGLIMAIIIGQVLRSYL